MSRFRWVAASGIVSALVSVGLSVPSAAQSGTLPQCTNDHLVASYRGGDAATSHVYGRIVLTNVSDRSCWVRGYGGLSYVGGGDGTQIGAPADRAPSKKPKTVLAPGEKVRSRVVETSAAPYPKKQCRPAPVDGFRVYVPDERRSQFVPHATTGCRNAAIHLLEHKAYR
jgi:hypothetical protein